ncbi:MAG: MBL fold metallo-hydrolase, partial [Gammaproteobacteria bacterium]|nr:MBL fold metallo-hydrolase [Gammaproteobacteria bacterium]
DFSVLPSPDHPVLCYEPMNPGETNLFGELSLQMVSVNHVVPAVGYIMKTARHTVAFSGDTTTNDTFWPVLNSLDKLDSLIVEAAFTNNDLKLSQQAGHYCPSTLAADLTKLKHQPKVYLSHHKPGAEQKILAESKQEITTHQVDSLHGGQIIPL